MVRPRYITRIEKIPELSDIEVNELKKVTNEFVFRSNEYYQSLINWDDPDDPIRKIVMPDTGELYSWGSLDASGENSYTVVNGCEHKYNDTAVLLVTDICGAFCRFCFRKRLFMNGNDEVERDVSAGVDYIKKHSEINNVLLTGGDPLLLSTRKLEKIIRQIRQIDHVKIIRIGTKLPAFNPFRITRDSSLTEMLSKYSTPYNKIYIMSHFNHPRELTDEAVKCLDMFHRAGCVTVNQTPLLRGVNDEPEILGELFDKLSYFGVPPYYVFLCRPTIGNRIFSIPIEEAYNIFENSRSFCSGLAKRARLTMSHMYGKIEVSGMTDDNIFFKFHRSASFFNDSLCLSFRRNPEAYWFDDYEESEENLNCFEEEEVVRYNIV